MRFFAQCRGGNSGKYTQRRITPYLTPVPLLGPWLVQVRWLALLTGVVKCTPNEGHFYGLRQRA